MGRWSGWLALSALVCACAIVTAASEGAPADREQASSPASPGPDADRDGLSDSAEARRYHTDPSKRDTDGDRLNDGAEVERYHTNPRQPDTDRDGLPDGDEVKREHTDPRRRDTDGDGIPDGDEVNRYKTHPRKPDTDSDGLRDKGEINRFKTNPRKPDTDGDGLRDSDEVNRSKTNPLKADTDGDQFGDGFELRGGTNPLNARSHLGFPNAGNSGVPAGTTLTPVGELTVRTNNAVVNAVSTSECIIVRASGVTIRNSKIGCVRVEGDAANPANPPLTIQDTEIVCPIGSWNTGIRFSNFTAIRVNIHGCENGLDIGDHVTLRDSYIHDLATGPDLHTDGIQSSDGSNSIIEHNTIYGADTSAININHDAGGPQTHDVVITRNLVAGGGYALYCPIPPTTNFRIVGNQFSTVFSMKVGQFGPTNGCAGEIQSDNVYHETGAPLNAG